MSDADLKELEDVACPGAGACGGQFTANTMAMALEFLGLSPMGTASVAATDPAKDEVGDDAGRLVMDLLRRGVRPRADRHPRRARERHRRRRRDRRLDQRRAAPAGASRARPACRSPSTTSTAISRRTPLWADLKPGGRFTAVDLGRAGGTGVVAQRLVDAGLVDGDAVTVTGRTFAEEAARARETPGQEVVLPLDRAAQDDRRARHPEAATSRPTAAS